MVTIYDIAKQTGFSPTTVSKALNDYQDVSQKTKKKILTAVEELGYLPNSHARSLTTKKSWTIGVVFMESLGVGMKHPFFNSVIESFRQCVEADGYDLLFASRSISNKQKSYLDYFKYRGVDGVVIISSAEDEQVKELISSPFLSVVVDLKCDNSSVIHSDNVNGSIQAVHYLHALGHRKIAHIAGHPSTLAGEQRLQGFLKAAENLQLSLREEYIAEGKYFARESGYEAMKKLMKLNDPPTAVYAAGDNLAIGAIKAIRDSGLEVPDDYSVIGFDDIELSQFIHPPLTTFRQNMDLIGNKAGKLLISQINNREKNRKTVIVPVELVERNSCRRV